MENNKSQAEIYREERKARLAKEAEKKAKKSPQLSKTKKVVGKVIAIVLAVAIGIGAFGGILNFFGVPQKVIKVNVKDTACSFTVAEFNFFYFNVWNNLYSQAQQYQQYGMDLGFDVTKSPAAQELTKETAESFGLNIEDIGVAEPTWADALRYLATNQLVEIKYFAAKAEEQGLTLTEEDTNEINTAMDNQRKTAKEQDYSLDRWLRMQIGNGVDEKVFRQIYEDQLLAQKYYEKFEADTRAAITDAQVNDKYNAEKDNYDLVDVRYYEFTTKTPTLADDATDEEKTAATNKAYAETKAQADAFLAGVKDKDSFISEAKKAILNADNKSTTDPDKSTDYSAATYGELQQFGEDVAKWVYDDARKVGDKSVIDLGNGTYAVVYMAALPYKDMGTYSHSVRHILVAFPEKNTDGTPTETTDATGNTVSSVTDATKAETKAKAQAILDEYLKNPTEENFANLAKTKTEDPGSKENGGLYEDLDASTSFVQPFKDWYLDASRKSGDTGIIETDYGYHIMYYSKATGVTWQENVKTTLLNESLEKLYADNIDVLTASIKADSLILKWAVNAETKHIEKLLAYSSSNSATVG